MRKLIFETNEVLPDESVRTFFRFYDDGTYDIFKETVTMKWRFHEGRIQYLATLGGSAVGGSWNDADDRSWTEAYENAVAKSVVE